MMMVYLESNDKDCYHNLIALYDEYIVSERVNGTDLSHEMAMTAYDYLGNTAKADEIWRGFQAKVEPTQGGLDKPRKQKEMRLHGRKAGTDILMQKYCNNGDYKQVLDLYFKMNHNDKTHITHLLGIKACTELNDLETGKRIHSEIENDYKYLYETQIEIKTSLITFYGKCSSNIKDALNVFNSMKQKDIVTVGSMMNIYIKYNENELALKLYDDALNSLELKTKKSKKEMATHKLAIKACTNLEFYIKGKKIHDMMINDKKLRFWLNKNVSIKNTLINFYGVCKDINAAKKIYDSMNIKQRDIITIGCMMNAYLNNHEYSKCIELFMSTNNPDIICYIIILKLCVLSNNVPLKKYVIDKLKELNRTFGKNYIHDIRIQNLLKTLESKSNSAESINIRQNSKSHGFIKKASIPKNVSNMRTASRTFNSVDDKYTNITLCNSMMNVCIKNKRYQQALDIFDKMNGNKNEVSYTLAIKACTLSRNLNKGKDIHLECELLSDYDYDKYNGVKNSLIHFYGILKDIDTAESIFKSIDIDDINIMNISAMMSAYNSNKMYDESLKLFDEIQVKYDDIDKDKRCFMIAIKTCSNIRNKEKGQKIASYLRFNKPELYDDIEIKNALSIHDSITGNDTRHKR